MTMEQNQTSIKSLCISFQAILQKCKTVEDLRELIGQAEKINLEVQQVS